MTSENIKDKLNHVTDSWNIQQKVFVLVTDNAANMKLSINLLSIRHMPCFAHTLNLAVYDAVYIVAGLNDIREKVRNTVGSSYRSRNAALAHKAKERKQNMESSFHERILTKSIHRRKTAQSTRLLMLQRSWCKK